ncbi:MAG: aspartate aminotransferase family protein [Candidatus Helarchaeota archaeon]
MSEIINEDEIKKAIKRSLTPFLEMAGGGILRGEPGGSKFYSFNGTEFIDCTAQAWTLSIGFANPDIINAVIEQIKKLTHVRYGYLTIPRIKLINKLTDIAPGDLKKVCFNNEGGSMANEAAIKLALINKKKAYGIITLTRGYHGSSLTMISASYRMSNILGAGTNFRGFGLDRFQKAPFPYCYRCPMGKYEGIYGEKDPSCSCECVYLVEHLIEHAPYEIAAILQEPIQGPGGQIPAPKEYLQKLRKVCNDYKVYWIWDEAQTAMGKIGYMFASEYYGVVPDMMTLTKALGGGFPIGATLASNKIKKGFNPTEEHTTFGSNPIMFAATLANLEYLEKNKICEKTRKKGEEVTKRLKELQEEYDIIGDIRGPGLFIGIELVKDRRTKEPANIELEKIIELAYKHGVLLDANMPIMYKDGRNFRNVLKFKPPLVISDEELDKVFEVLRLCFSEVS